MTILNESHPGVIAHTSLRVAAQDETIATLDIEVTTMTFGLDEVGFDGLIVGYVQRAGHVFVALEGSRIDRAEECGQHLLWDHAAGQLLARSDSTHHRLAA